MWKVKNIRKILTILFKNTSFLRLCYHKRFKLKYTRLPPLIQALKQTLGEFQGIAALCRHSLLLFKCDFISWTGVCDFIQPTRCVNSSFTAIWKGEKDTGAQFTSLQLQHFKPAVHRSRASDEQTVLWYFYLSPVQPSHQADNDNTPEILLFTGGDGSSPIIPPTDHRNCRAILFSCTLTVVYLIKSCKILCSN